MQTDILYSQTEQPEGLTDRQKEGQINWLTLGRKMDRQIFYRQMDKADWQTDGQTDLEPDGETNTAWTDERANGKTDGADRWTYRLQTDGPADGQRARQTDTNRVRKTDRYTDKQIYICLSFAVYIRGHKTSAKTLTHRRCLSVGKNRLPLKHGMVWAKTFRI